MVKTLLRKTLTAVAGVALTGAVAQAQLVMYSTTGVFAGGACAGTSCTFTGTGGTATLTYTGGTFSYIGGSTAADFGFFQLLEGPLVSPNQYVVPPGTQFTLMITQTSPSGGNSTVVGSVTGTFTLDAATLAAGGGLAWTPSSTAFSIGGVNYQIYTNLQTGQVNIALANGAPTGGACGIGISNPNCTTIQGAITTVPEPSTALLLGSGLMSLGGMAFRRRRQKA
jgi:hypothetical protein